MLQLNYQKRKIKLNLRIKKNGADKIFVTVFAIRKVSANPSGQSCSSFSRYAKIIKKTKRSEI